MLYVQGSDTSLAAALSVEGGKAAMCAEIFETIKVFNEKGMTCDEVEFILDLKHQTASARIRDLAKADKIFDTGERRHTRSGRSARVYKVAA